MALRSRRFFQSFEFICLPVGVGWIWGLPGLVRYSLRNRLVLEGWIRLSGIGLPAPVFRNALFGTRPRTRIYGPDRWSSKEILQRLADLDCVVLRWIDAIEAGLDTGDLDILVAADAADEVETRLAVEVGAAPIDLYSEDGSGGRTFKSVSYFPPTMARAMLDTAVVRPSGIKTSSAQWQYVAYCFHLLFHKSDQWTPGTEELGRESFLKTEYLDELNRLARDARTAPPRTVSDIEALLRERGVFPEIDTVGFYSEKNPFLRDRYQEFGRRIAPGLGVFLVREFGSGQELVDLVREQIESAGFRILCELPIDPGTQAGTVQSLRGGNWSDAAAAEGAALPVHAFVCHDSSPIRPSASALRRYPRLDNERMLLKERIRSSVARGKGLRKLNVVHASDNSAEAERYIFLLNADATDGVREIIAHLTRDNM